VPHSPLLPRSLRPRPVALTSLLALIAVAVALVAPARTLAHTHRSACPASSAKRVKRAARACAKGGHRTRTHRRRAGRPALVGSTATQPTDRSSASGAETTRGSTQGGEADTSTESSEQLAASCDDGSEPVLAAEETFACDDGSEPSCVDGSELTLSNDGSQLLCSGSEADPEPEASEPEGGGEPAGDSPALPRQPSPPTSSHRSSGS